jgi:wyosine [tRNA(Phe)-imidazoG37] synthetase (radical SAM superfamily)
MTNEETQLVDWVFLKIDALYDLTWKIKDPVVKYAIQKGLNEISDTWRKFKD